MSNNVLQINFINTFNNFNNVMSELTIVNFETKLEFFKLTR